ncbi:MAG: PolC-type DNA polymerase III [Christensenellales bacterium]|jgi:DNA polymerase-3 subunit alpha (Gram-positive type)
MKDWRTLLRQGGCERFADLLTLDRAVLSEAEGMITVCFLCNEDVSEEDRRKISAVLSEPFLGVGRVNAVIDKPVLLPQSAGNPASNLGGAQKKPGERLLYGRKIAAAEQATAISALVPDLKKVVIEGEVIRADAYDPEAKWQKPFSFDVTDYTDSVTVKLPKNQKSWLRTPPPPISVGDWVRVIGSTEIDEYIEELTVVPKSIVAVERDPVREDKGDKDGNKRVELHLHTHMSMKDGLLSAKDAIRRAKTWGHPAIAVTDHGVVQAFPEFYSEAKKAGIKGIFGCEGYLLDDCTPIPFDQTFVVVDLETTGVDRTRDRILEIGAVKLVNGEVTDSFSTFVNPHMAVPEKITKLTGITTEMVMNAPPVEEALASFQGFAGDAVLVAHNAPFDVGFLTRYGELSGLTFKNPYVDTLTLSRYLLRGLKNHKLDTLTEHFDISLKDHHRATCDATATAQVFLKLAELYKKCGAQGLPGVFPAHRAEKRSRMPRYHMVLLVKDPKGLNNLYRLVSYAHLNHFDRRSGRPCIPRSLLMMHREGLILGSACEAGELFRAVAGNKPAEEVRRIAKFYDYLEIQPVGNNAFMLRNGMVNSEDDLRDLNRRISDLAQELGKPCVATGDVHFLDEKDAVYRAVVMKTQGFSDADEQPPLFFKTTDEMLREFSYLGEERAREVVVKYPNEIADRCAMLAPFPEDTATPVIDGAEEELINATHQRAKELYGDPLPEIVQARLDRELGSITKYGFSVLYVIARKLVQKSNSDGYFVCSRGSVGSSLAAFLAGITEVNALPAHYRCPECKFTDFDVDHEQYATGADLPDRDCPRCGTMLKKDGYTIPFETFLGFEGDKVPDIDLNFSGEYQAVAHKFCEELFGEGYVFRAGTISCFQDKTAFGLAKDYCEKSGIYPRTAELNRLALGCCGVKRTTGQHPGGIVVLPRDRDIFDFTPLQRPADDPRSPTITTHFDFSSMHDTLVKLDILGHDDPTVIRILQDETGLDPRDIPQDDPATMSLFRSTEALGVTPEELRSPVGTYGVPEFGTRFVRQMLVETKPTTMEELVRISGLSHGTDVWTGNAQELIRSGICTLKEAVCTRDDIMNYLISKGVDKKLAFSTMEHVRKGRGLTREMEEGMRAANVPSWYIDSCKLIKYMFPRAHAAAYVMSSFRIAYYKVHHPEVFYAAYLTVRADAFDYVACSGGAKAVTNRIIAIEQKGRDAKPKEKELQTILEVVLEMNLRGIELLPVDVNESHATRFLIKRGPEGIRLLPPLNALGGLGDKAAHAIMEARQEGGAFHTQEDIMHRARVGQSVIDIFRAANCLSDLPETSQISLFGML